MFCLAALVSLAFAFQTDLRWEDYYITFRASKNLATGNGLVFQVGQRVHTYTSPLGTLLPAFTSWISGGNSDEAALWIFRAISIAFFAGSVALVWRLGRAWGWRPAVCALTAGLLLTDAKSVSFTINGMETGILLFFLALCLHVHAAGARRPAWALGVAWAGLMWSRPDGFIYIGATAAGFWFFPSAQRLAGSRGRLLATYLKSGLVCALLYGPWVAWAWRYYGSPIPNTVVAKTTGHPFPPLPVLLGRFAALPFRAWHEHLGSLLFMPAYFASGGWPAWNLVACDSIAVVALITVILPRMRPEARVLSLAALAGLFYVTNTDMYPWYIPAATFLTIVALGGLCESVQRLLPASGPARPALLLPWAAVVLLSATLLAESSWQLKWQQRIIEGQRKDIGLWLRANSPSPTDTVFLESLGYIGYYSQLKMYDYPGMSSPEVVAARKKYGENWVVLIGALRPKWLILRPSEYAGNRLKYNDWFHGHYNLAAVFDCRDKVNALRGLPGWGFLAFDETFFVYRYNEEAGD